jgi:hypothetical protein
MRDRVEKYRRRVDKHTNPSDHYRIGFDHRSLRSVNLREVRILRNVGDERIRPGDRRVPRRDPVGVARPFPRRTVTQGSARRDHGVPWVEGQLLTPRDNDTSSSSAGASACSSSGKFVSYKLRP